MTLEQTIIWRRLDLPGHDSCGLWRIAGGWRLEGTASFIHDAVPCHLNYVADCDDTWHALAAHVSGWLGAEAVERTLTPTAHGGWFLNRQVQESVGEVLDVDLGFTPATNLIQLRRLALDVGQASDAPAAYLQFPELQMIRLDQHYHRVAPDEYEYEAATFGYTGRLRTTETGFITHYPGLWEMEALR